MLILDEICVRVDNIYGSNVITYFIHIFATIGLFFHKLNVGYQSNLKLALGILLLNYIILFVFRFNSVVSDRVRNCRKGLGTDIPPRFEKNKKGFNFFDYMKTNDYVPMTDEEFERLFPDKRNKA